MVALAQLMPSLCELNLSLHRTAVPGLRQLLGSKTGTPMPTVKALRFMTESPVSLAFLAVAFPRLQTLSINVHHKGYRCTPWIIAKLSKLRYMKSLVTVQLFKLCWRHVDLRGRPSLPLSQYSPLTNGHITRNSKVFSERRAPPTIWLNYKRLCAFDSKSS